MHADEANKNRFSELWSTPPDVVISTTSSQLAFFEKHVEKYRLDRGSANTKQVEKAERILRLQKVGYKKSVVDLGIGPVEVISMRRFENSDCAASQYQSLTPESIKQVYRSVVRLSGKYQQEPFDELSFKLGVAENISRQRQWAAQNLPEILQKRLDDFFTTSSSIVERFLATYNGTTVPLLHGDLHLGNVFLRGHRTYILDPAENDVRFCLAPLWLEYATLVASLVLLGRDDLIEELIGAVREEYSDFDTGLFNLWVAIKILVRLRFEDKFLAFNKSIADDALVQWRHEVASNGPARLGRWLNKSSNLPNDCAPITVVTPTVVEALRLSNQIIESRRNELNAKSNVYVAVSIALVAGNITFLDQNAQALSVANVLLLLSAGIALLSAWRFLDLVRTLTGRSKAPKSRGRLFFFGWWAKSSASDIARQVNYLDEAGLANEIAVQNASLSRNVRFRYTAQTAASKTLGLAFFVFFLGIGVQVLGLGADKVSLPWGGSNPGPPSTNTSPTNAPSSNPARGNIP